MQKSFPAGSAVYFQSCQSIASIIRKAKIASLRQDSQINSENKNRSVIKVNKRITTVLRGVISWKNN